MFTRPPRITKRLETVRFLLQCPVRYEDLSKTSAGVDGLPTPILANKSLAASATFEDKQQARSTGDGNHLDPCQETEYYVFPSLYHKYINYANYEHCILTKTHFLSPFRCYARSASQNTVRLLYSTYRVYAAYFL